MKVCPECGEILAKDAITCPKCGCPVKKSDFKKTVPIVIVIVVVCAIVAAIGISSYLKTLPIKESQENFDLAVSYESNFDYESAILYYSKVIEEDEENYSAAQEKIPLLSEEMKINKAVAKAFIAAKNRHYVRNLSDMTEIKVGLRDKDTMAVFFKKDAIGYSVIPADEEFLGSDISDEEPYLANTEDANTGLRVVEYKAVYVYNLWLTETLNDIRQSTSNTIFEGNLLYAHGTEDQVNTELAQHYLDLYEEENDLSVFD